MGTLLVCHFQFLAVAFRASQFQGILASMFGSSLESGRFDGGNSVGAARDPAGEVLDSLFKVGSGVRVRGVEGIGPVAFGYFPSCGVKGWAVWWQRWWQRCGLL